MSASGFDVVALPRSGNEVRAQIALAVPLAAQQLGFQLMGVVDAGLLGRYDEASIAAAGVGNNLLFAITALGMGIVMGLDSLIPQAVGAGRVDDARRMLHAGLRLAVAVGLLCMLVVCGSPLVLDLVGVDPEVARNARAYVYLRAIGIIPFLASIAYRDYLAARGITRPLVVAVVGGNILNFGLGCVLIFGLAGVPALGIIGAGVATVASQLLILATYIVAGRYLDEGSPLPQSTRADLREVLKFGLPVSGHLIAEIGIFGVATITAAHLGTLPAAAHSIALNLASFSFSIVLGIGSSTSIRVGHAVGLSDIALARRRGLIGTALGLGVMACSALLFVAIPGPIARIVTDQPAVIAATVPLLAIAAVFQLSDGTQAVVSGALRGLGLTRTAFVANVIGHYAVGLPISIVLAFTFDMGVEGLWWGLSAGLTMTAIVLVLRFVHATQPGRRVPAMPPLQNSD